MQMDVVNYDTEVEEDEDFYEVDEIVNCPYSERKGCLVSRNHDKKICNETTYNNDSNQLVTEDFEVKTQTKTNSNTFHSVDINTVDNKRIIFHVDVDCFYVGCERMRNPSLIGKPVAIIQNNAGGFVSVSYEAKAKGIRKGDGIGEGGMKNLSFFASRQDSSMKDVLEKCPEIVVLPMDIVYYRSISERIEDYLIDIFGEDKVERHSIDDFYIDATKLVNILKITNNFEDLPFYEKIRCLIEDSCWKQESNSFFKTWIAENNTKKKEEFTEMTFMQTISPEHMPNKYLFSENDEAAARLAYIMRLYINRMSNGITLSCGIGCNKFLARMATDLHKPNNQTIVLDNLVESFLSTIVITKVPGFKSAKGNELVNMIKMYWKTFKQCELVKLKSVSYIENDYNSNNIFAIRTLPESMIIEKFGSILGKKIKEIAYGKDNSPVQKKKLPNQIMTEVSFPIGKLLNLDELKQNILFPLLTEVLQRVNSHYLKYVRYPTLITLKYRIKYESKLSTLTTSVPSYIYDLIRSDYFSLIFSQEKVSSENKTNNSDYVSVENKQKEGESEKSKDQATGELSSTEERGTNSKDYSIGIKKVDKDKDLYLKLLKLSVSFCGETLVDHLNKNRNFSINSKSKVEVTSIMAITRIMIVFSSFREEKDQKNLKDSFSKSSSTLTTYFKKKIQYNSQCRTCDIDDNNCKETDTLNIGRSFSYSSNISSGSKENYQDIIDLQDQNNLQSIQKPLLPVSISYNKKQRLIAQSSNTNETKKYPKKRSMKHDESITVEVLSDDDDEEEIYPTEADHGRKESQNEIDDDINEVMITRVTQSKQLKKRKLTSFFRTNK